MADNILSLENITKVFTERKVFDNTSFFLQSGEKVGVIGINGTGKSTLLRMIAGLEEPDEGTVTKGNHVVVRFLPQTPEFPENATVLGAVLSSGRTGFDTGSMAENGWVNDITDGASIEQSWMSGSDDIWTLESDAKSMLTRLGVYDFDQPVKELSGGQRKRLALVSALLYPADILVLDEPTNHLDQEMANWLENVLKQRKEALVMVTHDRYFLDSVTNRIIEVDKGKIYSYESNYSGYLELKMQREEMMIATEQKRQNILRKELAWIRRGARARSTKQKAHIKRYEALRDQDAPIFDQRVELESISTRMGKTTVELEHISKGYEGKILLADFNYIFLKNDRVGFVGPNGSGKTTLLKMIAGLIPCDEGNITIGQTIKIGYYSQELETENRESIAYMDPNEKVIDYIRDTAEYVHTRNGLVSASKMLERFLFTSSMQYGRIGKLSGGERRRLNLLRVLMEAPNVLLLDEPTNDLDIATLNILEDYLDAFDGIVVIVSHDRYFLDRTVNRIFAFEGNGVVAQYEGGWTDYASKRPGVPYSAKIVGNNGFAGNAGAAGNAGSAGSVGSAGYAGSLGSASAVDLSAGAGSTGLYGEGGSVQRTDQQKVDSRATWKSGRKLKFSFQEQKDYDTIEDQIAELEGRIEELDTQMLKFASDFVKLSEITKEKEAAEEKLAERMERWEYLEELAERIRSQ